MRITSGGNVGIGTTNPGTGSGAKLEVVQGTSTNAVARLVAPSSKTSTTQEYPFYITTNEAWASNPFGFEFGLKGNSTSSSRIAYIQAMTVNSSNDGILALQPNGGNVGIGTQSPATILDVRQSSPAGDVLMTMANTSANAYSGILLKNSSLTDKGLIAWANASASSWASSLALVAIGSDPMVFGTSNTERMRITSGGEVYIAGTTDQGAYNLQVNGTGVWGAGAYVDGSDSAVKKNIQPLGASLDIIKQMNPVTFEYQPFYSKDTTTQTGFIAQELQQVLSNKVYKNGIVKEGGQYLGVAYQHLIPLLVKSIQELEAQVQALKSQINNQ
jgi:hypothetical protein